jgi:hypothetical protein
VYSDHHLAHDALMDKDVYESGDCVLLIIIGVHAQAAQNRLQGACAPCLHV